MTVPAGPSAPDGLPAPAGLLGKAGPPEPCWLSRAEQAAWLALGALVTHLPNGVDADLRSTADLSLFEYLVLANLSEAPDHTLGMRELGARANSSPSRLSHGITRLERHGWVSRSRLPQDGRQMTATLTPAGLCKVRASAPAHVHFVRRVIIDVLSPEQLAQLHAIADTILTSLDAARGPVPIGSTPRPAGTAVRT